LELSSIQQFIQSFKEAVDKSNKLGTAISPYMATIILLRELDGDLPHWMVAVSRLLPKDAKRTMTNNDFYRYCSMAGDEVRTKGVVQLVAKPKNQGSKSSEKADSNASKAALSCRNAPPKGKDPKAYVLE
jgi:hypothetical protein